MVAFMICILRSDPIYEYESYSVVGEDWPGNPYRAHDRCIQEAPMRWREIRRDAVPPAPPPADPTEFPGEMLMGEPES
jgi:hypothetical protein